MKYRSTYYKEYKAVATKNNNHREVDIGEKRWGYDYGDSPSLQKSNMSRKQTNHQIMLLFLLYAMQGGPVHRSRTAVLPAWESGEAGRYLSGH